jgi:hypothetical protein
MLYTTTQKVREESGFIGNDNISDAFISNVIQLSCSKIDAIIADAYTLPLPTFYKNFIEFSGLGDDTPADIELTINGVEYTVNVTDGMTPQQVTDAFTALIMAVTDLDYVLVNDIGQGSIITIATKSGGTISDVQMSVTADSVNGIECDIRGVFATTVPVIEGIATCLSCARLLTIDYGPESQDTDKEGKALAKDCMAMLDMIASKELKLRDYEGNELSVSEHETIAFFPTEASRTDAVNPTANKVTRNKKW